MTSAFGIVHEISKAKVPLTRGDKAVLGTLAATPVVAGTALAVSHRRLVRSAKKSAVAAGRPESDYKLIIPKGY